MTGEELEKIARLWCQEEGHDPDMGVVKDEYAIPVVRTAFGVMKAVSVVAPVPLWQMYAKGVLKLKESGIVAFIKKKD